MNSLKKGKGVSLLNFVGDPGVPLLNFEGASGVQLLNFEGGPVSHVIGSHAVLFNSVQEWLVGSLRIF